MMDEQKPAFGQIAGAEWMMDEAVREIMQAAYEQLPPHIKLAAELFGRSETGMRISESIAAISAMVAAHYITHDRLNREAVLGSANPASGTESEQSAENG